MPRNFKATNVYLRPDPRFGSMLAAEIINKIMLHGKRSTAQKIFYQAVEKANGKVEAESIEEVFEKAIENIRPTVEVRSKRVGGANYQVPREVKRARQESLAIRWLVGNSRKKKGKPMCDRLAEEFADAYNGTGTSVAWKEQIHKMAEANKAFAHYRW